MVQLLPEREFLHFVEGLAIVPLMGFHLSPAPRQKSATWVSDPGEQSAPQGIFWTLKCETQVLITVYVILLGRANCIFGDNRVIRLLI